MTLKLTFALILTSAVTPTADSKIPLKSIWAWDMPGTTDVKEAVKVDPSLSKAEQRKISPAIDMYWILNNTDKSFSEKPMRGFVVVGTGKNALKNAQQVLSGKAKPQEIVAPDQELSLVFFSKRFARYAFLDEVTFRKSTFTIKYHFHSHHTLGGYPNFALIPVGKLAKGGYTVNVVQNPPTAEKQANKSPLSRTYVDRIVSKSFTFNVMGSSPGD